MPGMGPEELRTRMARLVPADLGMDKNGDPVLDRFKVKLLTEGSGTQIYSTTFAQWTTREVLRRAQAVTLLVRFAPRQRQRPLNELLAADQGQSGTRSAWARSSMPTWARTITGSISSACPALSGPSFVAWFEGHNQAVAIASIVPQGNRIHFGNRSARTRSPWPPPDHRTARIRTRGN